MGVYIFFPAYIAAGFLYIVVLSFFRVSTVPFLDRVSSLECQGVYVDLRYHDILRIVLYSLSSGVPLYNR